jgi:hypothetical protein
MVSFTPLPFNLGGGKVPGTYWTGGWVGNRTWLDDVEKRKYLTLPELELRPLVRNTDYDIPALVDISYQS